MFRSFYFRYWVLRLVVVCRVIGFLLILKSLDIFRGWRGVFFIGFDEEIRYFVFSVGGYLGASGIRGIWRLDFDRFFFCYVFNVFVCFRFVFNVVF